MENKIEREILHVIKGEVKVLARQFNVFEEIGADFETIRVAKHDDYRYCSWAGGRDNAYNISKTGLMIVKSNLNMPGMSYAKLNEKVNVIRYILKGSTEDYNKELTDMPWRSLSNEVAICTYTDKDNRNDEMINKLKLAMNKVENTELPILIISDNVTEFVNIKVLKANMDKFVEVYGEDIRTKEAVVIDFNSGSPSRYSNYAEVSEDDLFVAVRCRIDLRDVLVGEEAVDTYTKYTRFSNRQYLKDIINMPINRSESASMETVNEMLDSVKFAAKNWIKYTPVPKPEIPLEEGQGRFGYLQTQPSGITPEELEKRRNAYSTFWNLIEKYINKKSISEDFVTAIETQTVNEKKPSIARHLTTGLTGLTKYMNSNVLGLESGSHCEHLELQTYLSYNNSITSEDYECILNQLLITGYGSVYSEEEEVIEYSSPNYLSEYLNIITPAFLKVNCSKLREHIGTAQEMSKLLATKIAKHEEPTINFGSCTFDNVDKYMSDRKSRLAILRPLKRCIDYWLEVIDVVIGTREEISLVALSELSRSGDSFARLSSGGKIGSCSITGIVEIFKHMKDIDSDLNTAINKILRVITDRPEMNGLCNTCVNREGFNTPNESLHPMSKPYTIIRDKDQSYGVVNFGIIYDVIDAMDLYFYLIENK